MLINVKKYVIVGICEGEERLIQYDKQINTVILYRCLSEDSIYTSYSKAKFTLDFLKNAISENTIYTNYKFSDNAKEAIKTAYIYEVKPTFHRIDYKTIPEREEELECLTIIQ